MRKCLINLSFTCLVVFVALLLLDLNLHMRLQTLEAGRREANVIVSPADRTPTIALSYGTNTSRSSGEVTNISVTAGGIGYFSCINLDDAIKRAWRDGASHGMEAWRKSLRSSEANELIRRAYRDRFSEDPPE